MSARPARKIGQHKMNETGKYACAHLNHHGHSDDNSRYVIISVHRCVCSSLSTSVSKMLKHCVLVWVCGACV